MRTRFIGSFAIASTFGALAFGTVVAIERPAAAQTITVKCWKEYCVTDPETGKESCVREQIPCPDAT